MRLLIAASLLLASIASAAAVPSSCAGKFIGEWRHSGSGNRGSVKADGRALCSEHPACVQGTWTCSGNVFIYTNPVGTWNYTLAPDGRTMSTGSAVSTRLGPVPASARLGPEPAGAPSGSKESTATSSVCARIASNPLYEGGRTENERCRILDSFLSDAKEAGCEKDGSSKVRKQLAQWKSENGEGGRCSPAAVHRRKECAGAGYTTGRDYFYTDLNGKAGHCSRPASTGSRG
jgi:hypothetical protein